MVTTEILHDGLGNTLYRVARVFPNAASASHAVEILGQVNPAAFAPLSPEPWELELARPATWAEVAAMPEREYTTEDVLATLQLSDDDWGAEGEPPRCKSGACDL